MLVKAPLLNVKRLQAFSCCYRMNAAEAFEPISVPRFFQNCRSSHQPELEENCPLRVVCLWLGDSERTARKHYLKVRNSHFEMAAGSKVHQKVQSSSATCSRDSPAEEVKTRKNAGEHQFPSVSIVQQVHPAGLEPATSGSEGQHATELRDRHLCT